VPSACEAGISSGPLEGMGDFRWRPATTPWYRRKGTDPVGLALLVCAVLILVGLIWLAST